MKLSHFRTDSTNSRFGFCVLEQQEDGGLTPSALQSPVKPGHTAILREVEEEGADGIQGRTGLYLDQLHAMKDQTDDIGIANTTNTSQRLALCD